MKVLRDDVERLTSKIDRLKRNRRYVTDRQDLNTYDREVKDLEGVLDLYHQGLRGLRANR